MKLEECSSVEEYKAIKKCERILFTHNNIYIGISGGADSDIVIDIIEKVLKNKTYKYECNINYVFIDTGIEYEATKEHIEQLEKKYKITIKKIKAKTSVVNGCKKYGVPFKSKYISDMIERLQNHNFDFKNDGNKEYEDLIIKYPKCKGALKWWCNKNGNNSSYNINKQKLLKQYMIDNPPNFKISSKCCKGAKKDNGKEFVKENKCDLQILGLRKAENGIRSTKIKSCYEESKNCDAYRPIWWFNDKDKELYNKWNNINNSKCYKEYNLKRTGCAGCPFNSKWNKEIEIIKQYEPRLYKAITTIFENSYKYAKEYEIYKKNKSGQ